MQRASGLRVSGIILAGGSGRRMGGRDKGLVEFHGQRMIGHVIDRLLPQVDELIINANRNLDEYKSLGYPVISDSLPDFPGPLAGLLAGLEHAASDYVAFVPCDTPHVPADLVARLLAGLAQESGGVAVAHDGHRLQPLHVLVHRGCLKSLRTYVEAGGRRVDAWLAQVGARTVMFEGSADDFLNINTPDGLQQPASSSNPRKPKNI